MRAPRAPRGQAATELALGTLLLVPIIVVGLFLGEATEFKLEATEAATEPLWDATAYRQQSYTGTFNLTPSAVASATTLAAGRQSAHSMVFTQALPASLQCSAGGTPMGLTIGPTAGVYTDNGGMRCSAVVTVDPRSMTRFFLDQGSQGFFKESLARAERQFRFCESTSCNGFVMSIGDWGLTNQGGEGQQCALTMGGCANSGFFDAAKKVYQANRSGGGTSNRSYSNLVQGVVQVLPANFAQVPDFQMSFRGSESNFIEGVPVVEGDAQWRTTPALGAWAGSYGVRREAFLGR